MAAKEKASSEAETLQPGSEPCIVIDRVTDDQDPKSEEPTGQGMEMAISRRSSFRSPGLMTKIGRGVKLAVGGAINMIVGPGQDADRDFVDVCKKIAKALRKLHSKDGSIVPDKVIQAMQKTNEVVELKDICISLFGQHNCGKSTLLNALIGEELLPVYAMNETSVKIKVQHDSGIHQGVCVLNCPNLHIHPSKSCPKLQVMASGDRHGHEIHGADAIYHYLSDLNKKVREKGVSEPPSVVLKVNIPLLADKVPHGWTVSLVDNPGFGEAKEHVVQLADASMVTSSAYIYLLQTENIGGTEAAEFFKELIAKDKTAMTDGRLVIGITKFDTNYKRLPEKSRRRGCRFPHISKEKVREKMIASIKDATDTDVTEDMNHIIVPLCGDWALAASRLASCLISDPDKELEERKEDAATALACDPHLCLPGGQEQSQKEAIKSLEVYNLICELEKASGIHILKARIHFIVGNACVKVWATKILSEFQHYVEAGQAGVKERCNSLIVAIKAKVKDYKESKLLYDEIKSEKERIKATAPPKKKRVTPIWLDFEAKYQKDLEKYKPQEKGKARARDLVKEFKDMCQNKISSRSFGPEDFEDSIHKFLTRSAPELQMIFDSSCGFWNVCSVLLHHVEDMVERITNLRSKAKQLCKMNQEEVKESYQRGKQCESTAFTTPNLAYIKSRVTIPSVSLRWWEKIIEFFRYRRVNKPSNNEDEKEIKTSDKGEAVTKESENESDALRSAIFCDQSFISSQGDSDSDDEDRHKNQVPQSNSESGIDLTSESNSTSCTQTSPNVDGTWQPSTSTPYRKWTKELDDAITVLQNNIELECDRYFDVIKPNAIKFFYKDYRQKTTDRLHAFDKDFSGPLEEEQKRLKKLNYEIDCLQNKLQDLEGKNDELEKLRIQVLHAYRLEFEST